MAFVLCAQGEGAKWQGPKGWGKRKELIMDPVQQEGTGDIQDVAPSSAKLSLMAVGTGSAILIIGCYRCRAPLHICPSPCMACCKGVLLTCPGCSSSRVPSCFWLILKVQPTPSSCARLCAHLTLGHCTGTGCTALPLQPDVLLDSGFQLVSDCCMPYFATPYT